MNTERESHESHEHDDPEPESERPESAEKANAPDAVQAAEATRRHGTEASRDTLGRVRGRGVEWVRPTDLIARHTSTLAGRGIDVQAELARRTRAPMVTGVRRLGDRARRLPPLSAFGRAGAAQAGPVRSGVGMS